MAFDEISYELAKKAKDMIQQVVPENLQKVSDELAQKVAQGQSGAITHAMLSQEVREEITGGSVAVVGKDAVIEVNIVDGTITPKKTSYFYKNIEYENLLNAGYIDHSTINTTTGVVNTDSVWTTVVTDFIVAVQGDVIRSNTAYNITVVEFDINKTFLRSSTAVSITMGSNTAFIRVQTSKTYIIVKNINKPTETVTAKYYFNEDHIKTKTKYGFNLFNKNTRLIKNKYAIGGDGVIFESDTNQKTLISDKIYVNPNILLLTNLDYNVALYEYRLDTSYIKQSDINKSTSIAVSSETGYIRLAGVISDSDIEKLVLYIATGDSPKPTYPVEYGEYGQTPIDPYITKESLGIENNIISPKKQYVMKNTDTPFFFTPMMKRRKDDYLARIYAPNYIASIPNIKNVNSCGWVNLSINESRYGFYIFDSNFQTYKKSDTTFVIADATTNNGTLVILPIGDSITDGNKHYEYVNENCPSVSFVGMMRSSNGLKKEARTGWKLEQYATLIHSTSSVAGFSPFLHPVTTGYKYYGCSKFWIECYAGNVFHGEAREKADELGGFNATTGLKINPSINDVMYNYSNSEYEVWNGSAWTLISEATLGGFVFDFGKYLTTWSITQPNIVTIMLGTNDYSNVSWYEAKNTLNAKFKGWYDTMITSIHAVSSSIKISLLTPPYKSTTDNIINDFTKYNNLALYENRKNIITYFDGREFENIYLVDTGSAVDTDNDFTVVTQSQVDSGTYKPWMLGKVVDPVHPASSGFSKMGMRIAAFIQAVR